MPTGEPVNAEQLNQEAKPSSSLAVDLSASEESGQETQPKDGGTAEPGAVADDQAASDSAGELELDSDGESSSSSSEAEAAASSAVPGQEGKESAEQELLAVPPLPVAADVKVPDVTQPAAGAAGVSKSSSSSDDEALLAVEAQALKKWREARDLTDDGDFAFWFDSFEQAKTSAGFVVAKARRQIRACQMLGIARTVSDAFDGEASQAAFLPAPIDLRRMSFKPGKTSFQAIRAVDQSLLAEKKPPKPEVVSALRDCILAVGGLDEEGVDHAMREQAADCLIADVSKKSEPETLQRAARTWVELLAHSKS